MGLYRIFTILPSADIAGMFIEKISPYQLFPICRLLLDIETVYRNKCRYTGAIITVHCNLLPEQSVHGPWRVL